MTAWLNSVWTKQCITQGLRHIMVLFHKWNMTSDICNEKSVLLYTTVSKHLLHRVAQPKKILLQMVLWIGYALYIFQINILIWRSFMGTHGHGHMDMDAWTWAQRNETLTWTDGYGHMEMDTWTWTHGHWHMDPDTRTWHMEMDTWTWTHGHWHMDPDTRPWTWNYFPLFLLGDDPDSNNIFMTRKHNRTNLFRDSIV
jgi:hypothetical protein